MRLVTPFNKSELVRHFEIKTLDHTANTYVAVAAIIATGLEGIKQKLELPEPFDHDPDNIYDKRVKEWKNYQVHLKRGKGLY